MSVELSVGNNHSDLSNAEKVALGLANKGWHVLDNFLSPLLVAQLREEAVQHYGEGRFRHAGVGRKESFEIRPEVRTDQVKWISPVAATAGQKIYLEILEMLRLSINQSLYLGLFEFEGHLAVYPPGTYYKKHLDQFHGVGLRTITTILYLNEDWNEQDGGQLRIYNDPTDPEYFEEILPFAGRLVTFFSARYLHEVLPSTRDRISITGWFKKRA